MVGRKNSALKVSLELLQGYRYANEGFRFSPQFHSVGRYGDSIRFSELPSSLHVEEVAANLGAISSFRNAVATVVCGSPGEVHNRVRNGERHAGAYEAISKAQGGGKYSSEQRLEIWLALALSAGDQLRQRVAWALCQILVISPDGVGGPARQETESWLVSFNYFQSQTNIINCRSHQ